MQRIIGAGRQAIKRILLGAKHVERSTGKTKRKSAPSARYAGRRRPHRVLAVR